MSDQNLGGMTGAAFGQHIVEAVRAYVDKVTAPLLQRITELERACEEKRGVTSVSGGVIDRDGHLVLTLSNGTQKDLGRVVGKDVNPAEVEALIKREVGKIPPLRDAFGFDDLELSHDGERTLTVRFARGEHVKEFPVTFPVVLDRGVWREGEYAKGDAVTWGGSLWIAQEATTEKPEDGAAWRLAVKRGRNGKDGTALVKALPEPVRVVVPTRVDA